MLQFRYFISSFYFLHNHLPFPHIIPFLSLISPLHIILLFRPESYFSSIMFFHHQTLTSTPLYHFTVFFPHRVFSPVSAPGADRSHRPRPHIRTRNRTRYVRCLYLLMFLLTPWSVTNMSRYLFNRSTICLDQIRNYLFKCLPFSIAIASLLLSSLLFSLLPRPVIFFFFTSQTLSLSLLLPLSPLLSSFLYYCLLSPLLLLLSSHHS